MDWRLAHALETLRTQVNERWPHRSRDSDGSIGDANHASRSSDHNPWIADPPRPHVVSAIDITHDPHGGFDSYVFAEILRGFKDPRIKYLISNRKICSSEVHPWLWRPYTGSNPHDHHIHISVLSDKKHYDDTTLWKIDGAMPAVTDPGLGVQPPPKTIRRGANGDVVKKLQRDLEKAGITIKIDGDFGPVTQAAVQKFQAAHGLVPDGVVGPQTWGLLES